MTASQRPGWSQYHLGIAEAVAARGDCLRSQVGAVLVRPDQTVASTGFNGSERGGPSCLAGECPRALSDVEPGSSYDSGPGMCHSIHAESNALAFAREDTAGMTLYVTRAPCAGCQRTARAHRIARIVWPCGELRLSG